MLSSVGFIPFSSVATSIDLSYSNGNRSVTETSASFVLYEAPLLRFEILNGVTDIAINNDAILFLTDGDTLSAAINSTETVSSIALGHDWQSTFNRYYNCIESHAENDSVEVYEATPITQSNLIVCPYKTNMKYTIIPLRSSMAIDGEYDIDKVEEGNLARNYTGVYFGNNQEQGYDNVYLQYVADRKPITFKLDQYTKTYLPQETAGFNLSATSSGFVYGGAFAGCSPCDSDVIMVDQFGYPKYTNNGEIPNTLNGRPLCIWLSGSSIRCNGSYKWMERWYDPNIISQGEAFIATKNGATSAFDSVVDIPSSFRFGKKTGFSYLRYGPKRNDTFVRSFSSDLVCHFEKWGKNITDEVNDIHGFVIGQFPDNKTYDELDMNGHFHVHVPPTDELFFDGNLTFGSWVYQDNWSCGIDTQFFGNFSNNEGYGLFFNTSANPELITFPTTSGFIYGFNNRGLKVFEKSLNTSLGVSASRIDLITTDLFGSRWTYDGLNKKIYKLDTDDLLKEVIALPTTSNITKLQINSQNELYILNTKNNTISGFDPTGNLVYGPAFISVNNNFEINRDDEIVLARADILVVDNNNDKVAAMGINLYKNDALFYHIGAKVQSLNVDSENNYWVVYGGNKVLKLDSDGNFIFRKSLTLPFDNESSLELNFVKENKNGCDYDVAWIVFNTYKYIVKLDEDGNLLKRINIADVVNLKKCGAFALNVDGDFTGFDSRRKFFNYADGSQITSDNPAISLKINLKCGNNKKIVQVHTPAKELIGWNHLAFSYNICSNNTTQLKIYVNGTEKVCKTIEGLYVIDYGTKVSPFIIGGHSGKLGAKNVERSLNDDGFFIGKIDDVRIYNKLLTTFQLRGLAMAKHWNKWEDMIWYMPTPNVNYMEEVMSYHLNRYKGSKSNKFNIKIKNLDVTDSYVQESIKNAIASVIDKISPANTELNEILFE